MKHTHLVLASLASATLAVAAPALSADSYASPLVGVYARERVDLGGPWRFIVDPLEQGIRKRGSRYSFELAEPQKPFGPLVEYDWDQQELMPVPSDWNSVRPGLELYDGMAWYRRTIDVAPRADRRTFLYFEAVNYKAQVWLNTARLGEHEGGFTPFAFEVTDKLQKGRNAIVVSVSARHSSTTVPEVATDWWTYGGITRPVWLVSVPRTYVHDVTVRWDGAAARGEVLLAGDEPKGREVTVSFPELSVSATVRSGEDGKARFELRPKKVEAWSPERPKLYRLSVATGEDRWEDEVGLRTIEVKGNEILLNGTPVFLRGISIHEEALGPAGTRRLSWQDAEKILRLAKEELGCNFVRLAHYPHSERMTRTADRLGLLVWSEVPVYWDIAYKNPATRDLAVGMVSENVMRDRNRASIVVWSVANETPITPERTAFLGAMVDRVRALDPTRLVSAALDRTTKDGDTTTIDDPIGERLDLLAVNEYEGWYGTRTVEEIPRLRWKTSYAKPMIFSEFGAEARVGTHGRRDERWTEEYQAYFYSQTLAMAEKVPNLRGMSPWILKDFRTPRRFHGLHQNFWNRKGLVGETGEKKLAFDVLKNWYAGMARRWAEVFR